MAKQQSPKVSSDDADVIIDLTEIVQKGKPPLVSKPDVDFDSALSDLMGKTPAMKLDETPELEALLSGIDADAPKRKAASRAYDEPDEDAKPLANADDMDSLLNSLEEKSNKNQQPAANDVDSLLDSLMDDLNPPSTTAGGGNQEISEDDLDDLLTSIEQDSKQSPPAAPKAPDDLDELLAGLSAPKTEAPKAAPKAPDDLDELLAGLSAPKTEAPKAAPKAPDDLDELLAGLSAPKAAPNAEPKPVDSIDDLLAGLDSLAKPAAPEAKQEVRGIPDADLDDLLAGLDTATPAPKAVKPPTAAPVAEKKADFGDMASLLDAPATSTGNAAFTGPAGTLSLDDMDGPDAALSFDKPTFGANDFDDLDSLFVKKSSEAPKSSDPLSGGPRKADSPPARPAVPLVELEMARRLPEFTERLDRMETEFFTLQERLSTLESRPAEPQANPIDELLAEGSPLCNRLMGLVRTAMAEELQVLSTRVESAAHTATALDARAESLEKKLPEVALVAAKALAKSEIPVAPQPVSSPPIDLEPLTERLNALEAVAVRQEELDVQAERLDALEASSSKIDALEAASSKIDALEAASLKIDALEAASSKIDALEAASLKIDALEAVSLKIDALEAVAERLSALEVRVAALAETPPASLDIPRLSEFAELPDMEKHATSTENAGAEKIASQLAQFEPRLSALEARPYVPLETIQGAFDQMGDQLNAPLQQFQNRIALLEQRLADDALSNLAGDLLPFMSASIDKAAAASAALALREELEALMSEGSDESDDDEDSDEK